MKCDTIYFLNLKSEMKWRRLIIRRDLCKWSAHVLHATPALASAIWAIPVKKKSGHTPESLVIITLGSSGFLLKNNTLDFTLTTNMLWQ